MPHDETVSFWSRQRASLVLLDILSRSGARFLGDCEQCVRLKIE